MTNAQPTTLCPVLVADLADARARERLRAIAIAGGRAFVPLLSAPVDAGLHELDVYAPGSADPLVLRAIPDGAPTAEGFPLRLFTSADAQGASPPETATPATGIAPKRATKIEMSERHTRELAGKQSIRVAESLLGRTLAAGKLHIESLIGAGGAGVVYRAIHRDLRMPVAVKVLHETFQNDIEFCRRFHAEALAASRLDHQCIVRVLDYGQEADGLLYLAMEHLDGTPLSAVIENERALSTKRIVEMILQVCAALAHAHARGVVHRDVKPDNIVVTSARDDDGNALERVKVCDFGIAVVTHDDDGDASQIIAGTPAYMAPEQWRGEPLDGRSDVYACGVVLYELATGQVPFDGDARAVVQKHLEVPPLRPSLLNPAIDARLEAIILKALAKDPNDRQPTMRALRGELRALVDDAVESERTPPPAPAPSLFPRRITQQGTGDPADWLEHGSSFELAVAPPPRAPAVKLGAWLKRFAEVPTLPEFRAMANELASMLPLLVERRDVRALFAVHSTLLMIRATAARATHGAERVARVRDFCHALEEPSLLHDLAEAAIARDDRDAARLLENIGVPAAYALYSKRLKLTGDEAVRRRFIEIVHAMGASALPMMRAGLAKLAGHRERPVACELAMDLLLATPSLRDEELGELAARWARGGPVAVARAAIPALAKLWGERSRPLLTAALSSPDVRLASAAAHALRGLGNVDERLARRVAELTAPPSHGAHSSAV